jgi:hypothetical protein
MSSMATWQVEPQYRTGRQVCLEFEFLSLAAGTTCDGLVGGWVNLVEYFPHGKGLVEEFCHKFLRGTRAFAVRRGVLSNQSYQTGQCSNRNSV